MGTFDQFSLPSFPHNRVIGEPGDWMNEKFYLNRYGIFDQGNSHFPNAFHGTVLLSFLNLNFSMLDLFKREARGGGRRALLFSFTLFLKRCVWYCSLDGRKKPRELFVDVLDNIRVCCNLFQCDCFDCIEAFFYLSSLHFSVCVLNKKKN